MSFSTSLNGHERLLFSNQRHPHFSALPKPYSNFPPITLPSHQRLVFAPTDPSKKDLCCRARPLRAIAASGDSNPSKELRRILQSPGIHQGPAVFDALSARLVERAGFGLCFTSGFSISAARLGLPDTGLISYGEMVDQGSQITQAVSIPVIGDGDNGYGNHINVKRTVKGFIRAGFAGILLEDQVSPKACGHTRGRKVVSREDAVMRIKAAIDAREESGSDIVIIARTDSRQAVSLEESLWRSRAFADAGADVLFIDALASREEMKAFCEITPLLPKLANMLEGGGKTPILNPIELEEIGFKLVAYPLSLIGVSIQAMQDALAAIKSGRIPPPGSMPSFDEMKETLGFNAYYEEEKRYTTVPSQPSFGTGYYPAEKSTYMTRTATQDDNDPVVEVITPYVYDDSRSRSSGIWSRSLRVKITGRDGLEKLDMRVPAGFLEGITNIVPGLMGVNIKEMLDDAAVEADGSPQRGKVLLDFNDTLGDRIQVFIE
ncbi:Petal death protein [Acorus calamus]|uniref:Petal death protein n=1 Tax=Acorus calamus TaxID=4465 RepID=A0AAV9D1J2_ACOCL|nr:Petal death protein [Acorus calamus]